MPGNVPHVQPPSSPSQLPAKMMYGAYIVRLEVAGRGLDFWLDSERGASSIIHSGCCAERYGVFPITAT